MSVQELLSPHMAAISKAPAPKSHRVCDTEPLHNHNPNYLLNTVCILTFGFCLQFWRYNNEHICSSKPDSFLASGVRL